MSQVKPTLFFTAGETCQITMDTEWDLTGYTVTSEIRNNNGEGALLGTFTDVLQLNPNTNLNGRIFLTLDASTSANAVPGGEYAFDVKLELGAVKKYIPKVWIKFNSRVTA
jgi:hypothetical protein